MKHNALKASKRAQRFPERQRNLAQKIHDMRQPLQAMRLLHGVLAEKIKDEETRKMIARLEETLISLHQMLESTPSAVETSNGMRTMDSPYPSNSAFSKKGEAASAPSMGADAQPAISIIDDDPGVRESMGLFLSSMGYDVDTYESCEKFLETHTPDNQGCLIVDALLPGMNGLELLHHLKEHSFRALPIMITGHGDVSLAVQAMKAGAADFVEKPVNPNELLAVISAVLKKAQSTSDALADRDDALARLARLSERERQVMDKLLAGYQSKNIAIDLGVSRRTVETHRANIMRKTGIRTLSGLLKLALALEA